MKNSFFTVLACCLCPCVSTASEALFFDREDPANVEVQVGSLGPGIHENVRSKPWGGYSFGINYWRGNMSYEDDRFHSDVDTTLLNIPIVFHYYPMHGNFYLAAGIDIHQNKGTALMQSQLGSFQRIATTSSGALVLDPISGGAKVETIKNSQGYFFNSGHGYDASHFQSIEFDASYRNFVTPYLGIGYQGAFGQSRWGYHVSAGMILLTNPKVSPKYNLSDKGSVYYPNAEMQAEYESFKADLSDQAKRIESDLKNVLVPVVQIGLTYSF